ncbi:MAG: UdgX family uracil-DNA binding protein [Bacteroidota bacterium]
MRRSTTSPTVATKTRAQNAGAEFKSLKALNKAISASHPWVKGSGRAVLGEGPIAARLAFVGEQPGDQEDVQGHPFVGQAGKLFDRALVEAGLDRRSIYVTNAVKHFKFEHRGKRRIHQRPTAGEVKHYRWWLDQELKLVNPRLVVALGATAVLALVGERLPIAKFRGTADFKGRAGYITVHPSYLLRFPDRSGRERQYREFVRDLRSIHKLAGRARRQRTAR